MPERRGPPIQPPDPRVVHPDRRRGRRSTAVRCDWQVCPPVMVDVYS